MLNQNSGIQANPITRFHFFFFTMKSRAAILFLYALLPLDVS